MKSRSTLTEESAQRLRPRHWNQGYAAGQSGEPSDVCPYKSTRGGYRTAWLFGWARGMSDRAQQTGSLPEGVEKR